MVFSPASGAGKHRGMTGAGCADVAAVVLVVTQRFALIAAWTDAGMVLTIAATIEADPHVWEHDGGARQPYRSSSPTMVAGGSKHRLPHASAAMKATGGSTTVGWRSRPRTRSQWSPTRRSSANSLAGVGHWPSSRSNTSSYPRCPNSEPWWRQRLGTTRGTPY